MPRSNASRRELRHQPTPVEQAIIDGEYLPGVIERRVQEEIGMSNAAQLAKSNNPVRIAEIAATLPDPYAPLEEVDLGHLENAMRSLTLIGIQVPDEDPAYQLIVERAKSHYEPEHLAKVEKSLASYGIHLSQK